MHLIQQLKTVPLYIQYFFLVVDEHSIQAPLAYQLYTELKKACKTASPNEEIEQFRRTFIKDHTQITGNDMGAGSIVRQKNTISSIARYGISSEKDCLFIQKIAEFFESRICVELGTSLGIASSYLAKAKNIETVFTFEGNEQLANSSKHMFDSLQLNNIQHIQGNIDDALPAFIDNLDHIDLAIIDANHTERSLLTYFNLLKGKISEHGVMIIDDIRWSTEMYNGWRKLVKRKEVSLSMDFMNRGLLIFEKSIRKQHYILSY